MNLDLRRIRQMKYIATSLVVATLVLAGCAGSESAMPPEDAAQLEAILEDVRLGWEQGDGAAFYSHFLDWEAARYF